jgi:hypothetical protein
MNHDTDEMTSFLRSANAPGGLAEIVDERLVAHSLRDTLADTEVREVSFAEFLAELRKCGRQLA